MSFFIKVAKSFPSGDGSIENGSSYYGVTHTPRFFHPRKPQGPGGLAGPPVGGAGPCSGANGPPGRGLALLGKERGESVGVASPTWSASCVTLGKLSLRVGFPIFKMGTLIPT